MTGICFSEKEVIIMKKLSFLLIFTLTIGLNAFAYEYEYLNSYYSPSLIANAGYGCLSSHSPSAPFYNPALYHNPGEQLEMNFSTSFDILQKYSLAFRKHGKRISGGIGTIYITTPSTAIIDYSGNRTGKNIDYHNLAIIAGVSTSLKHFKAGVNMKVLNDQIMEYSTTGIALGFGVLIPWDKNLLGISLEYLRAVDSRDYPLILRWDYEFDLYRMKKVLVKTGVGIRNSIYKEMDTEGGVGLNIILYRVFVLKGGFNLGNNNTHFTFGGGLKLDYSKNNNITVNTSFKMNKYSGYENLIGLGAKF